MSRRQTNQTRPPVARMIYLADCLRRGRRFNTSAIANAWEVSRKTVTRDLDYMRCQLGFQIEWSPFLNSYRLLKAPRPRL